MKPLDLLLQRIRMQKASAHIPDGASVLDIGCGQGELFDYLRGRIGPSVCIDEEAIDRETVDGHQLQRGQFPEDLRVPVQFDTITMLAVVEHLPQQALESLSRTCSELLKERGVIVITVPSPLVDHILVILRFLKLVDAETLHQHHGFVPGSIPGLFSGKEFTVERMETFELGLNNLFVIRKRART